MVFLLIGVSLGALLLGAAGMWALHNYGDFFSYTNLSNADIIAVRTKLAEYYDILSAVRGRDFFGNSFVRGIYVAKDSGNLLYFKYTVQKNGNKHFELYPLITELWSTNRNILGSKSVLLHP